MRKWTWMIILLVMAVATTACSSANDKNEVGGENKASGSTGGKTVVTIAVVQRDPGGWLEQAEAAYESKNPDVDIVIKEYVALPERSTGTTIDLTAGVSPADLEKYRNAINTDLMSGKGADIVSVSDLDYEKYKDKGVFADLGAFMEKDPEFDPTNLFGNVMDAANGGGKKVIAPIWFGVHNMSSALSPEQLEVDGERWTWDDLLHKGEQLAKDLPGDLEIMGGVAPTKLVRMIVMSDYDKYINLEEKKVSFDTGEFAGLLNQLKELYGTGLLSDNYVKTMENKVIFRDETFTLPMVALESLKSGRQIWNQPSSNKHAGLRFSSTMMLAINAKSKVTAEAWKFLSYLLSEEAQSSPGMFLWFPMNKAATAGKLKGNGAGMMMASPEGDMSSAMGGTSDNAPAPAEVTAQDVERLMAFIGQAGYFHGSDPRLLDIVETETAAFFTGEKSAESVAKLIQNRAKTYLNE
ncbi:carbohydrate ABC transporter substrate-binding protein [Paenibacillus sp. GSMTC-2017]|uniref:ABC transporter substrate-binding protein n=1 Tax=Paenibacillus sp. GSMTC-2017 TaxID=2794350 RepID=UPI0018D5F233|nr:ABC transporter substrate-binding protein [Paenibacillus sp. GSMTC-2017]MBH5319038.1 carbohydrate ABC transporter substrate-binding protein [Paenibacillus sp. GSMTC-2017]